MTSRALCACTAALALALAGCGGGAGIARRTVPQATDGSVATARQASTTATPAVSPALARLRAVLDRGLRAAGPSTGALVYDLNASTPLFAAREGVGRPPASVEKLYTSVALLQDLGPAYRVHTELLGVGHLGPGGIWHGDLYLRGGGDPTFGDSGFNRVWEDGEGATANALAAQLRARGIRRITGHLISDASLFDGLRGVPSDGFRPDIPDLGGQLAALTYDHGATGAGRLTPGQFAAREVALTLRAVGIRVPASKRTLPTPPGAGRLAMVSSPPMAVLLRLMDVPSDDFFAEMLTKLLGARLGGAGSIAAGAAVIRETIATAYDVHPAVIDGSGLSRADRSSPGQVVALLRRVWRTPLGSSLWRALPTVGVNGTVRTIGVHTPAQGHCVAKTGTLDGVTNLAGYCHASGGHVLAFALFLDGPSNARALALIGKMAGAIAGY